MNGEPVERLERTDERLLSLRLARVIRRAVDERGEVPDADDLVLREEALAQLSDVEPFVWRPSHGPVVEVEAVDVYECPHRTAEA